MKRIFLLLASIFSVMAIAQDGALDPTYNPSLSSNVRIERVLIQADGKALIQENHQSEPYLTRITRLLDTGGIDNTFNCALGTDKPLSLGGLQPDGKIFVIQNSSFTNAQVYRLNSDGSLDTSFKTLTGADGIINSGALQPDGKIIITGMFSNYNGTPTNKIIRLEANGDIDPTFQYSNPSYRIANAKLLSSGKVLILCQYTAVSTGHLIRLNANGSFDTGYTFSENCAMYPFALQSDEKTINQETCVDWGFDEPPHEMLYRLNTDGTPDNTYASLGFDTITPVSFWVLPSDSIIVSGFFTSYGGMPVTNILKLDENGQLDQTFNGGSGPNGQVWDIAQQPDGKLILVGSFTAYSDVSRNHIVRLYNATLGVDEFESARKLSVYPNPASSAIEMRVGDAVSSDEFEIYDINSRKVNALKNADNTVNVSELQAGVYFLKVKTANGVLSAKFIKN